jgi:hypothetical protein
MPSNHPEQVILRNLRRRISRLDASEHDRMFCTQPPVKSLRFVPDDLS